MAALIGVDRLSCGIPVCIQTSDESQLFSITVWISGGSVQDPVGKGGLAHLCEHLLLRPLMHPNSRAHRIQLGTGALVNAFTDTEWVSISAQAPLEQSKHLIRLLSALVCDPYYEADGIKVEKEVILQELWEEQPSSEERLVRVFRESAFSDNPCNQPVGGTSTTLGGLKRSDVQGYYTRFLNGSKMLITAYGGANFLDMTAMLNEAFHDFPGTAVSSNSPEYDTGTAALSPPAYRPIRIHKEISKTDSGYGVLAGFSSAPRRTEAFWTALAFEVLMADGPESLLYKWLRNERHWIYGAISMTEAFSGWGSQYFLMRFSDGRAEEAIKYLGQQWRALPGFVTEGQLEALKNRLASRALLSLAKPQDRMTLMRDTALAETSKSVKLEGGLEAIVARIVRELNSGKLLSYIHQYVPWDRVSLVCGSI